MKGSNGARNKAEQHVKRPGRPLKGEWEGDGLSYFLDLRSNGGTRIWDRVMYRTHSAIFMWEKLHCKQLTDRRKGYRRPRLVQVQLLGRAIGA